MTTTSPLSIVIVNYNTTQELIRCLDSLLPQVPQAECWVVDNASDDFPHQALEARYPQVRWILNKMNRGFAAANNQAMAQAHGEWIWCLNPDTEIPLFSLESWLQELSRWTGAGIIGTRLVYPGGRLQLSWGRTPHLATEAIQRWWWNRLENGASGSWGQNLLNRKASQPRFVNWVLGASFFVRCRAIQEVGVMDEQFHMYFEEVDWSVRMRKAGWKVLYHPGLTVVHWRGRAVAHNPQGMEIAYRKSQLAFYRKHHGKWAAQCLVGYLNLKYRRGSYTMGSDPAGSDPNRGGAG